MQKLLLLSVGLVLGLSLSVRADEKIDFAKQIRPIFAENCYKCHAGSKHKGNFRLDSVEAIKKGGKEGSDIIPGDPSKSDVFHRVSLPEDDDDVMPPSDKGKHLNKDQVALIKAWIAQGAEFGDWKKDEVKAEGEKSADSGAKGEAQANADEVGPKEVALPQVAAASTTELDQLRQAGAQCLPLCQGTNLLAVEFTSSAPQTADAQIEQLAKIGPQIYDLNLAGTKVTDEGLKALEGLTNLRRLHLEKTAITDAGLSHLKNLTNLEYLNLYHTGVTDAGMEQLQPLKKLKSLYVWQTKVTDSGAETLKKDIPGLNVDLGWKEPAKGEADAKQASAK